MTNIIGQLKTVFVQSNPVSFATCGVSGMSVAGICPACCMLLYCSGVMCSNPGGGTSQYSEGFLRLEYFFFSARGERERLRSRDLDLREKKITNQFNTFLR